MTFAVVPQGRRGMAAVTVSGREFLKSQQGFTYIALLLIVAIMGAWIGAVANVWHLSVQREKEQELLFIGHQFRLALNRYAAATAGNAKRFPSRLEDLLLDDRFAARQRHLRRIYVDPMTGRSEWGLIRSGDGQILGVHSLSNDEPIKKAGFLAADIAFTAKSTYSQWVFFAANTRVAPPAAANKPVLPTNFPALAQ